jgi:uncharacterized protein
MIDRTIDFIHALRRAGLPVSVSEGLDATAALQVLPLEDRAAVRGALAATLVKTEAGRPAFDVLFDLYFSIGTERGEEPLDDDVAALRAEVEAALGGSGDLAGLAGRAVEAFGRVEDAPTDSLYFEYPVLRALDLDALLIRLEGQIGEPSELDRRLEMDRLRARIATFRDSIRKEVRARVAARKGPEEVARYAVRPLLEDLDLATATIAELDELRRAIHPLARRLATRVAIRHRRGRRGRPDIRRTIRRSLSTGGVPLDISYRRPAPHRPELFVLCDVSDSVARFSRFSLMLVHALQSQFARVRSFAFVDTLDEVTTMFDHEDFLIAVERLAIEADVVRFERNSNYGSSLERFLEEYGNDVTAKATVLVLGDARNNNRSPQADVLKEIARRAHKTYWLNPESESYWDTGDSIASAYAAHVDRMVEVRTVRQLEDFIASTL